MSVTAYKISDAVTEICTRLNDPNFEAYASSTDYTGRALESFWSACSSLLAQTDFINGEFRENDIHGLVGETEIAISSNEIDLNASIEKLLVFLDVYSDPKSAQTMLTKYIRIVSREEIRMLAGNDDMIDSGEALCYKVGDLLKFVSAESLDGKYVSVVYAKEPDRTSSSYDKDYDLYGLFTDRFIAKIIDLATDRLSKEISILAQ